ncbi:alpha/beta hydrolase [Candidatus Micrarchaeota archaeon]|nr:alpha/beta hydrolase [Candidatus Micrarchaeota archaeon]
MDERLTFRNVAGDALAAILSVPPKPNGKGVVLLHCFTCTKHHRVMRSLAESLSEAGFSVLRFDFGGNGESGGKLEDATYSKMLDEVRSAVTLLRSRGIDKVGVAGHSMGAMLSLLAASEDERISAVGFISGSSQAARVREVFPQDAIRKAEKEGSAEAFVYGRHITIKREFLLDVEKFNVGHAAATLGRPILIVHGTEDEVIPPFHARQIFAWASGKKTLDMMEGVDHLFRKDADLAKLRDTVCAWFCSNL